MTSVRVTAGSLRGRRINVPPTDVRPTSERARQAFFNIIGERIEGASFLDLFSGTGVFSFEAVSRGARHATAIELGRRQAEQIVATARAWDVPVTTVHADALAGITRVSGTVFDVVYADPPYDYPRYDDLLKALDSKLKLATDAVLAIEHQRHTSPFQFFPSRLRETRRAEYGEVWITFFSPNHDSQSSPNEQRDDTSNP